VDEVVAILLGEVPQHGVLAPEADPVPADVGNPQRLAVRTAIREALDAARQEPPARGHAVLVALFEQELEPETQAQVGPRGGDGSLDGAVQALGAQAAPGSAVTSGTSPERASALATLRTLPKP
jgi:hypothetical protein